MQIKIISMFQDVCLRMYLDSLGKSVEETVNHFISVLIPKNDMKSTCNIRSFNN